MVDVSFGVFERRKEAKLDPLLSFKWACLSLPLGLDPTYVEEVDLTFPQIQAKEGLFGAGTYTYYPAFEDISAFDITFYEDSKLTTSKWLKQWFDRIRRPRDGAYYLPTHYKFDIKLALLDTSNSLLAEVTMVSVWPTGRGNWPLEYKSGDRLTIQQNFSVDAQSIDYKV